MDWILGNWIRINDQSETTTQEKWEKFSDTEYLGHGYVVKSDTIVWEVYIKLYKTNNEWSIDVSGVYEEPTKFILPECTDSFFIAENLENDFPTHIKYFKEGNLLTTKVYNREQEKDFEFEKL